MPRISANRKKIIEAAHVLFYQHGYDLTSFSEIAESADVPRGNFYYYFKSKNDLLRSVIEMRAAMLEKSLTALEFKSDDPLELLSRAAEVLLREQDEIIRYGCPLGTLHSELCKNHPDLQSELMKLFDVLVNWFYKRFIELGYAQKARALALHMLGRMQGISLITSAYQDKILLRDEIDSLKAWLKSA